MDFFEAIQAVGGDYNKYHSMMMRLKDQYPEIIALIVATKISSHGEIIDLEEKVNNKISIDIESLKSEMANMRIMIEALCEKKLEQVS